MTDVAVEHRTMRLLGVSIMTFGIVALLGSIVALIATDRGMIDVLQVAVIFSGVAIMRGGRRAVYWGTILTGFYAFFATLLTVVFLCGGGIRGFGDPDAPINTRPWMIAALLPLVAWTILNFMLCLRIRRSCSRESRGLCVKCGYDLRGGRGAGSTAGGPDAVVTCPECGATR